MQFRLGSVLIGFSPLVRQAIQIGEIQDGLRGAIPQKSSAAKLLSAVTNHETTPALCSALLGSGESGGAMSAGKALELRGGEWAGIQETLDFITAQFPQHSQLVLALHSFSNCADVEATG